MEHEDDGDSLFGSPPPSPRISTATLSLPSASICDNERRLSTSTDTQNVGTIALPGSHLYSELPLNPLALSLNHLTVHRPPAQSQDQPTTAKQTVPKNASESRRSSQSPFSDVPSRDPEFSLPDPSEPPPAHFLRNQQNLLGKAGLVAGVNPSTIAHIRGTSFNPIVINDEDTPLIGRQSRDSRNHCIDPSLLPPPTNEDIVSALIGQKDIIPVLGDMLGIIGRIATQPIPTPTPPASSFFSRNDPSKQPPIKKRKLDRVPAGATDWDVPFPFQEGEGPDEYHKTWERKRAKDLVTQLVKLVKLAADKAAIKKHQSTQATQATQVVPVSALPQVLPRKAAIEKHQFSQSLGSTPASSSSSRPSLIGDDAIDPALLALSVQPSSDDNFSMSQALSPVPSSSSSGTGPMTPTSLAWEPDTFTAFSQGVFRPSLWNGFSQGAYQSFAEGGGWDETGRNSSDFLSGMMEEGNMVGEGEGKGKGKEVLRSNPLGFLSADATLRTQENSYNSLMETQSTNVVLPPSSSYEQLEHPRPVVSAPVPPRPKYTISQSRKEEILKRAREKRRQVQEELDNVKTRLWEATIEQAALVHLLKRYKN